LRRQEINGCNVVFEPGCHQHNVLVTVVHRLLRLLLSG
jgi:hypothetical protein